MTTASKQDAVDLLDAEHKAVKTLFNQFKKLCENDGKPEDKKAVAEQICFELSIHAKIEEEIFYPPVRAATKDDDMMDEAEVEHAGAKDLIAQIQSMSPEEDLFDAKVTVLGEYIDHHVKEEREEMFPKARKTKLDLFALADELAARRKELEADPSLLEEEATA